MLHPRGVPRCRRVLLLVLRQAPVPGLVPKAAARDCGRGFSRRRFPGLPFCPIRGRSPGLSRCFFLHRFRSPVRYRIPGPASGRSFVRVCRGSRCRCIPLRHRPVPDREKRIFAARLVEDRTQPCGVAVGDQDLPERIFGHEADQLLHAPGVELVEEVVQQQDRFFALFPGDDGVLRQFEGYQERFLLSLRPVFAQGVAADFQHQVVAVDACRGEFVGEVFLPCREEQFVERPVVQLRLVVQFDLLAVAREGAVIVRDDGLQPLREPRRRACIRLPCSTSCRS